MNSSIQRLEDAVLRSSRCTPSIPEPSARWKTDLMRTIRLTRQQQEPALGMGPVAWKWAGAALAASVVISVFSSRYGGLDDYFMMQSELAQTADYVLAQSL